MKYGTILIGLLFLINPNICIVDILPDFIGYILLIKAFRAFLPVSPDMGDAIGHFGTLLKISLIKLCCLPVLGIIGESERTFYLILAFAFSILEVIFFFYAFSELFSSFSSLSIRFNGKVIGSFRGVRIQTFLFVLVKAFFTVLPELSNLSDPGGDEFIGSVTEANPNPFAAYRTLLYALDIFFVVLAGLIFIGIWIRFLYKLRRDRDFSKAIAEALLSETADYRTVIKSTVKSAFLLLCIGCALTASFITDGLNVIPNFIAGICFLLAFWKLSSVTASFQKLKPLAWVYSAISLLSFISQFFFARKYNEICSYRGLSGVPEAIPWFSICVALTSLSCLMLMILFIRSVSPMEQFISDHCGITAEKEYLRLNDKIAKERTRLRNLFRFGVVGACVTGVFNVVNYLLIFSKDPVIHLTDSYTITLCVWSLILLLDIAWTIYMFYTMSEIRDMVYERYT